MTACSERPERASGFPTSPSLGTLALMPLFSEDVIAAVLHHMNTDHAEDNRVIVRAHSEHGRAADTAVMTGLDEHGGTWRIHTDTGDEQVTIPWPGGPIADRASIRRKVVELYRSGCESLDIPPRTH